MATYQVIIEETISRTLTVDASNSAEAAQVARTGYRMGEIVLEPGELEQTRLCVVDVDGELGAWEEI